MALLRDTSKRILILLGLLLCVGKVSTVFAQETVPQPNREFVFLEDVNKKKAEKAKKQAIRDKRKSAQDKAKTVEGLPFDINAKSINYEAGTQDVVAEGDVIFGYYSGIIEATTARFNVEKEEATLSKDVRVTEATSTILADEAWMNFNTGEARLDNADMYLEEGDYRINSQKINRSVENTFTFDEVEMTTCQCPEGRDVCPWKIKADSGNVTPEGYGHLYDITLYAHSLPVFYSPYMLFPAKTERQSGLLAATLGTSKNSDFMIKAPLYIVFSESADMTLSPLFESSVRSGVETEFRKVFSQNSKLTMGGTYLNESSRHGDLLGTNVDNLSDPSLDINRFAGYLYQNYRGGSQALPIQTVVSGHYVSDDLLLRELDDENIGLYNARYVTSKGAVRTLFGERYSAELNTEYNQAMVDNDDYVFQRLPQALITGSHSLHPFGENPIGAKLVLTNNLSVTDYYREVGYWGVRSEVYEKLALPFHVGNYFDTEISGDMRASQYSLQDTEIVDVNSGRVTGELPSSSDRLVPGLSIKTNSVIEKIFAVDDNSALRNLLDIGPHARNEKVVRLKHTIEPMLSYRYVPDIDQEENPQFDYYDQLEDKSLVTYGVTQRIYGRYEPLSDYLYGIEELTPEARDYEGLSGAGISEEKYNFGYEQTSGRNDYQAQRGSIKELMRLKLTQSYNILDDNKLYDGEDVSPYSDLGIAALFFPNEHIALGTKNNYNLDENRFSSYSVESCLTDRRGDEIRNRLSFIDSNMRQLETSLQLRILERVKLGYYTRYDDLAGKFLEQKVGLRFLSTCNCWIFDIGISDKINPDETKVMFNITLLGLGEIGNSFISPFAKDKQDN
ncbi:MAG: LPS-assembly protein LptD [Deltaproteobacteria bacterium]|nr:LPS-assembly protein LptD [Deltaproteobacteria bacterium]